MAMILYVGNYTDESTYKAITENGIRDLSQAARLFQERLLLGLSKEEKVTAFSVLPSSSSIILPKLMKLCNGIEVKTIAYSSPVSSLKTIEEEFDVFFRGQKELKENVTVLMYAVNPIGLLPLLKLRKKYCFQLATVCPELPQYRRYKRNFKNGIKRFIFTELNRKFDKYVVFSENMIELLPHKKEYFILEGFAPNQIYQPLPQKSKKIAMYAGGLAKDNGIELMVEATKQSHLLDELWICGVGDCEDFLENLKNEKVKYFGQKDNSEVVQLEREASILLNLRNPNDSLTKFSFPSKVLEYMASGSLVLSTRLGGISKEYYQHLFVLDDYSANGIAKKMDEIFSLNSAEYLKKAEASLSFVQKKQADKRIAELCGFLR